MECGSRTMGRRGSCLPYRSTSLIGKLSGAGPAPEDRSLRLDQQPGQQVCRYGSSGSDTRVVTGDQRGREGQAELVEPSRGGQVAHEMRATLAKDAAQPTNSQRVQR